MYLICDFRTNWGGWFQGFVAAFRAAGVSIIDVEETLEWSALPGPTLVATHHAASNDHVLSLPRKGHRLGAYVHSVCSFPFTVGFRPESEIEMAALRKYDRLFVATHAYERFLLDLSLPVVCKVGYPFDGEAIWPVTAEDREFGSGCIAQRLGHDNNPWVAAAILSQTSLPIKSYFTSAGGSPDLTAMFAAAGILPTYAPTHTNFLQMLGRYEWMVSASFNESFGVVFAEAARLGVKVMAPRVPGLDELFEPSSLYEPFSIQDAVYRIQSGRPAVPRFRLDTSSRGVVHAISLELGGTP